MTNQLSDAVDIPYPPLQPAQDALRRNDFRQLFNSCTRLTNMFESQDAEWAFDLQEMRAPGVVSFPTLLKNNTVVLESSRI